MYCHISIILLLHNYQLYKIKYIYILFDSVFNFIFFTV